MREPRSAILGRIAIGFEIAGKALGEFGPFSCAGNEMGAIGQPVKNKRKIEMKTVVLAVTIMLGSAADSAEFQDGLDAYMRGDFKVALPEFESLARQGNAAAQYNLAIMHHKGQGVPQDSLVAIQWYRNAARQGHPGAQHNLGVMYGRGDGVNVDVEEAARWFHRAANKGHFKALMVLGTIYHEGEGVPKDNVQAYKWFKVAATLLQPGDLRDVALDSMRYLSKLMTREEIENAIMLARDWSPE